MNLLKIVLTVLGYAVFAALAVFILPMVGGGFLPWIIFTVAMVVFSRLLFNLIDGLVKNPNEPQNLTAGDVKSFFASKTFWLAALMFISSILNGLFGVEIDEETQTEIVNLDWSNILQAFASVLILAIRKYDILKWIV